VVVHRSEDLEASAAGRIKVLVLMVSLELVQEAVELAPIPLGRHMVVVVVVVDTLQNLCL
jgi:hypothetical protein